VGGQRREEGTRTVVLGDTPNDDSIGARASSAVSPALLDWELEVRLLRVGKGEVLVVVVGVGVCSIEIRGHWSE